MNRWQYETFDFSNHAVIYHPNRKVNEPPAITLGIGWADLAPDLTAYLNSTTDEIEDGPDDINTARAFLQSGFSNGIA